MSSIVGLLQPGQPGLIGFVARAAVDALTWSMSDGISAPGSVALGVVDHSPTGLSFHVVEGADELRLRDLDRALAPTADGTHPPTANIALWLSKGSSRGVSTALTVGDSTVLSVSDVRRQPRVIDTAHGEAIGAHHVVTLTIAYPGTHPDPTGLLLRIVGTIQTQDWSTEL